MAKNQNTFEKRRREVEKKRKAADKIERRRRKKERVDEPAPDEPLVEDESEAKDRGIPAQG